MRVVTTTTGNVVRLPRAMWEARAYAATDRAKTRYSVLVIPVPPGATEGRVREEIDRWVFVARAGLPDGREVGRRELTWAGRPATEVVLEGELAAAKPVAVMRLTYAGGRLYGGWIETTNGRPRPEDENGFFDKDLKPEQYLTEGWQQRVFEQFSGKYGREILLFYINHLDWEIAKAELRKQFE